MATTARIVTGVDFVGMPTKDLQRAVEFYGETLGLRCSVHIPERHYAEFEPGDVTISVWNPEEMGMEHRPSLGTIALNVEDVHAARKALEDRGVSFHADVTDTGVCHMAFFTDPDGNALMLHHRYAPREAAQE